MRRAALLSVHDSPTIAAQPRPARPRAAPPARARRSPDLDADSARRARARRRAGTRGTACAPRRVAASRAPGASSSIVIRTLTEGNARMSGIRPNKEQFIELMNAPDEGPVVMLNLLKFKPRRRRGRGARVQQVRRRGRADGRGARRQGAVDGQGRPDPDRRPRRRRLGLRSRSCSTRAARRSSRWYDVEGVRRRRTSTASRASSARCCSRARRVNRLGAA